MKTELKEGLVKKITTLLFVSEERRMLDFYRYMFWFILTGFFMFLLHQEYNIPLLLTRMLTILMSVLLFFGMGLFFLREAAEMFMEKKTKKVAG